MVEIKLQPPSEGGPQSWRNATGIAATQADPVIDVDQDTADHLVENEPFTRDLDAGTAAETATSAALDPVAARPGNLEPNPQGSIAAADLKAGYVDEVAHEGQTAADLFEGDVDPDAAGEVRTADDVRVAYDDEHKRQGDTAADILEGEGAGGVKDPRDNDNVGVDTDAIEGAGGEPVRAADTRVDYPEDELREGQTTGEAFDGEIPEDRDLPDSNPETIEGDTNVNVDESEPGRGGSAAAGAEASEDQGDSQSQSESESESEGQAQGDAEDAPFDPNEYTVSDLEEELSTGEHDHRLGDLLAAEADGKDRKSAKEAIQGRQDTTNDEE